MGYGATGVASSMAAQQVQNAQALQKAKDAPEPTKVTTDDVNKAAAAVQQAAATLYGDQMPINDQGKSQAAAESAYNTALQSYKTELEGREAHIDWERAQQGLVGYDQATDPLAQEHAADVTADNALNDWGQTPHNDFVAGGTAAPVGGSIIDANGPGGNPGAQDGEVVPTGYGATAVASGNAIQRLQTAPGYAQPPPPPADGKMSTWVASMSQDQAYFLGWAMAQKLQNKEVAVPPQDAQAWNALEQWEMTYNPSYTGTSTQLPAGEPADQATADKLAAVNSTVSLGTSQNTYMSPGDIAKLVAESVGETALNFIPGAGEAFSAAVQAAKAAGRIVSAAAKGGDAAAEGGVSATGQAVAASGSAAASDGSGTIASETSALADNVPAAFGKPTGSTPLGAAKRIVVTQATQSAATRAAEAEPTGSAAYLSDGAALPGMGSALTKLKASWQNFADKPLWGSKGPSLADFKQGAMGDCWMQSALQNMFLRNPKQITDMITPMADKPGWYNVKLPNPDPTATDSTLNVAVDSTLPADSKGNLLLGGSDADGIGGALIEKAVAKAQDYMGGNSSGQLGFDGIDGGSSWKASNLLTGPNAKGVTYLWKGNTFGTKDVSGAITNVAGKDQFKSKLEAALTAASAKDADGNFLQSDEMATVSFPENVPSKFGVYGPHVYSVLDFDPKKDIITLLDPNYGTDATPAAVKMSLDDFLSIQGAEAFA